MDCDDVRCCSLCDGDTTWDNVGSNCDECDSGLLPDVCRFRSWSSIKKWWKLIYLRYRVLCLI